MKTKFVFLLSVLSLGLAGCLKNDSPNVAYYKGAAIVKDVESTLPTVGVLFNEMVVVPGLVGTDLEKGDLLWSKFYIEEDKQIYNDSILATGFSYYKIDSCMAKPAAGIESDYTYPIDRAVMWINHAENIWVFEFEQTAPDGQTFDYEVQYSKDNGDSYPTIYIRSKETGTVKASNTMVVTRFGVDLTQLIRDYDDQTANSITFNVKYLSGFDSEGKEMFTPFQMNPIELGLPASEEQPVVGEQKVE